MEFAEIKPDIESGLIRLQREHKTVTRLLTNIKSYKMEPKNYDCFMLMQQLKNNLMALYWDQRSFLDSAHALDEKETQRKLTVFCRQFKKIEEHFADYLYKITI